MFSKSNRKMMFSLMAMIIAMVMLGGCGGSSGGGDGHDGGDGGGGGVGGQVLQGSFTAGPVEGLTYTTSSGLSGTTNASGHFSYRAGDTIVFNVGNISLPEIGATSIIYPLSYFPGQNINDVAVLNFVRFLMSAGTVHPNGGITIHASPFGGQTGAFPAIWDNLVAAGLITVTQAQAQAHIDNAMLTAYAGSYNGTWSGTNVGWGAVLPISGSWQFTIAQGGAVTGTYSGSFAMGGVNGVISGNIQIQPDGSAALSASGQAIGGQGGGVVVWTGQINLATGAITGTYQGPFDSGTFSGQRN